MVVVVFIFSIWFWPYFFEISWLWWTVAWRTFFVLFSGMKKLKLREEIWPHLQNVSIYKILVENKNFWAKVKLNGYGWKFLDFWGFRIKKNLVCLPLQKFEEEELSIFVKNLKGLGHTCLRNTYYLHWVNIFFIFNDLWHGWRFITLLALWNIKIIFIRLLFKFDFTVYTYNKKEQGTKM